MQIKKYVKIGGVQSNEIVRYNLWCCDFNFKQPQLSLMFMPAWNRCIRINPAKLTVFVPKDKHNIISYYSRTIRQVDNNDYFCVHCQKQMITKKDLKDVRAILLLGGSTVDLSSYFEFLGFVNVA